MIELFVLMYGFVFGSFFNVVGLRVPKGQSLFWPHSACPRCNHKLHFAELIPVFSYVWQRGRCRVCRIRISPLYPLIEFVTALLFWCAYMSFGLTADFFIALILMSLLLIIIVSDLTYMVIPDKILFIFLFLFLMGRTFHPLEPWWDMFVGGAVGFFIPLLVSLVSKGGMGGGDIKLFGVIGLLSGLKKVLVIFFLSCALGAVCGVVLMMFHIIKKGKPMPFAPFIALATLAELFYGEILIHWYLQLINYGG
ncbi:prepilin peptidase [Bacillus sp. PK3_68]|nr:A24 family peptidase [Bacillus sp. PK3_68]RJS59843.1 prepilin peptidase [Bacillus sp. PK3_68]